MYKFILQTLLFITYLSNLNAEIVKKIDITGNSRVSDETVKIYGEITLNSDYNEQKLNSITNNLYYTNFLEDVKIELTNNVLKIYLIEYPVINNLIILGEPKKAYEEQIRKLISLKNKDSFIKSNLSELFFNISVLKSSKMLISSNLKLNPTFSLILLIKSSEVWKLLLSFHLCEEFIKKA